MAYASDAGVPEQPGAAPMVSVAITAYQHAPYLAACLDGVLMQQCPFAYEVLLGEDGSSDGTREIAQRYAAEHPLRIRLFLHERSSVIHIDGRPTGRYNFLHNLRNARGRYLCHIDGDDRWTDPDRLRIMVEKMENEPDLTMAFHNAVNVWDDGSRELYLDEASVKPRFSLEDLMAKNFIPTSGVIWRWTPLTKIPKEWYEGPFGDWLLNVHFARQGPIGYVDRVMSERHVHGTSSMATMDPARTFRAIALGYAVMRRQVGGPITGLGLRRWIDSVREGFHRAQQMGSKDHMRWFSVHARAVDAPGIPFRERARWWALLHLPAIMRVYHRMRGGKP